MAKPQQQQQQRKIDVPRAMVIMGFKTSRQLEAANGDQRRQLLDTTLFNRMQEVQVGKSSNYYYTMLEMQKTR